MKITCRFINPIVIAPVTAIVGLGLLEYGFPGVLFFLFSSFQSSSSWYPVFGLHYSDSFFVYFLQPDWFDRWLTIYNRNFPCFSCFHQVGKCVEIGIPALLFILIFSQVTESWARKQTACCLILFWVSVLITLCTVVVACLVLSLSFGILPSSSPAQWWIFLIVLWWWAQHLKEIEIPHIVPLIHHIRIFELFPIIFGVVIVWVYATILTVAGAYDHASALGQLHCRTDRSGLVSHAPW